MKSAKPLGPSAWTADEVRQDASWIQRLSAAEVEGFDLALEHARRLNKPLLAVSQADFPLSEASRNALARAVATQCFSQHAVI